MIQNTVISSYTSAIATFESLLRLSTFVQDKIEKNELFLTAEELSNFDRLNINSDLILSIILLTYKCNEPHKFRLYIPAKWFICKDNILMLAELNFVFSINPDVLLQPYNFIAFNSNTILVGEHYDN